MDILDLLNYDDVCRAYEEYSRGENKTVVIAVPHIEATIVIKKIKFADEDAYSLVIVEDESVMISRMYHSDGTTGELDAEEEINELKGYDA